MESSDELLERLRLSERAAAAPYVDYPATPWWHSLYFGAYAAAFVGIWGWVDNPIWRAAGMVLLAIASGVLLGWQRSRRGVWPRGAAPAEIQRVTIGFLVGLVAVVAVGALLIWLAPVTVRVVAIFVIVTGAVWWYERAYAHAAERARARLGAAA